MRRINTVYELDDKKEFDTFLGFIRERGFRAEERGKDFHDVFDIYPSEFDGHTPHGFIIYGGDLPPFVRCDKPILHVQRDKLLEATQEYIASRASAVDS
jgi:hypothetical protein